MRRVVGGAPLKCHSRIGFQIHSSGCPLDNTDIADDTTQEVVGEEHNGCNQDVFDFVLSDGTRKVGNIFLT